jgi:hypothetical protein
MRSYRLAMVQKAEQTRLLLIGADGKVVNQRAIVSTDVEAFISRIETGYNKASPDLEAIGDDMGRWLNGTEGWLERLDNAPTGAALHINVPGRLRLLPWELVRRGGRSYARTLIGLLRRFDV